MIRLIACSLAAIGLVACDGHRSNGGPPPAQPVSSASTPDRGAKGGAAAVDDPTCKAEADARLKNFLDGGGKDEHRSR